MMTDARCRKWSVISAVKRECVVFGSHPDEPCRNEICAEREMHECQAVRVHRFRSGVRQKDSIDPNSMGRYLHVVAFPGDHRLDHRSGSVWTNTRPTIASRVSQRGERAFQAKLNERRFVARNHIKKTRK